MVRSVRIIICFSVIFLFLLGLVIGCSDIQRHRVLTFFFDGVPPIGLEYLDPNSPEYRRALESGVFAKQRSRHEPYEDCSLCHDDGSQRVFGAGGMNMEIPELCFECHQDDRKLYVHGPVAVGECLFCHDPHGSSNEKLLKKPIPVLCFQCHDSKYILEIEGHSSRMDAFCNECHEGHSSSIKRLLKSGKEDDFGVRSEPDNIAEPTEE